MNNIDIVQFKRDICEILDLSIDPNDISTNTNIIKEFLLDSLSIVDLMIGLEEKYKIEIRESDLLEIDSLSKLHCLINNKIKNFKFKLATCAFVNFAVIENTFLYAVVSNFISLLNASLAVRYPNILRGRLFIHCWIFLIV